MSTSSSSGCNGFLVTTYVLVAGGRKGARKRAGEGGKRQRQGMSSSAARNRTQAF